MTLRATRQREHGARQQQALLAALRGDTSEQLRIRVHDLHRLGFSDHRIAGELQLHVDQVRRALAEGNLHGA